MTTTRYPRFFRIFCAALFFCLVACNDTEADSSGQKEQNAQQQPQKKLRLMIAVVDQGPNIPDTLEGRCDAALNLIASELPDRFEYVSFIERNQAIHDLEAAGTEASAGRLAGKLNVDRLVFIKVMRLENMLRAGLAITLAPDYLKSINGVGYSLIRYRNEKTGERVYDTALLEALQRALADAFEDPSMFDKVQMISPVRPAPPLVITGIRFDDKKIKPSWKLYENRVVNSYEMVLKVFEAIKDSANYVAYDIDSRDSIYAMRNLLMAENYQAPTPQEMAILESFDVHYIISGSFVRTDPQEAELTLMLGKLNKGMYSEVKRQSAKIRADDREQLMSVLQNLARKLVE